MEWRERIIKEIYDGDEERFEREYPDLIERARSGAVSWHDLNRCATVYPDLVHEAKEQIEYYLGYLPAESVTITFEPFLRSLIHLRSTGALEYKEYSKLAEEHIRLIRNEDVRHNLMEDYDQALYEAYNRDYLPYGAMAKQRLVDMLGYAPNLKHSLVSELYLRTVLANDRIRLQNEMTPLDYKVITLIRYRQVLSSQGKQAADNWPVLNCEPEDADELLKIRKK